MDLSVKHDKDANKYYTIVEGRESVCEYTFIDENTLNVWHAYVPPELRGRGIADELVRQALEDLLEKGCKVIPSCWFVRVYMDRHPRYHELRA